MLDLISFGNSKSDALIAIEAALEQRFTFTIGKNGFVGPAADLALLTKETRLDVVNALELHELPKAEVWRNKSSARAYVIGRNAEGDYIAVTRELGEMRAGAFVPNGHVVETAWRRSDLAFIAREERGLQVLFACIPAVLLFLVMVSWRNVAWYGATRGPETIPIGALFALIALGAAWGIIWGMPMLQRSYQRTVRQALKRLGYTMPVSPGS